MDRLILLTLFCCHACGPGDIATTGEAPIDEPPDAGPTVVWDSACIEVEGEAPYDDFAEAVQTSIERWGIDVVADGCTATVLVVFKDDLGTGPEDRTALGRGMPTPEGGRITLLSDPGVGPVENISAEQCRTMPVEAGGQRPFLLLDILSHEMGHVLGYEHSEDEASVMYFAGRRCVDRGEGEYVFP